MIHVKLPLFIAEYFCKQILGNKVQFKNDNYFLTFILMGNIRFMARLAGC